MHATCIIYIHVKQKRITNPQKASDMLLIVVSHTAHISYLVYIHAYTQRESAITYLR